MPDHIKTAAQVQAEALALHKARVTAAVDAHVEAQARALHYSSAAQLTSYVASTNPEWAAEASRFVGWRDLVWAAAIAAEQDAVQTGVVPSVEDVIASLPEWGWE
jgi:hypothetical protein